ncbi:MAG: AraC family transcriptional regulator [Alphaproteobacteria bacterium PRO2]|nr:AraC family transcriptional regulator [Alphaproteobacteria bacterium PRO2]
MEHLQFTIPEMLSLIGVTQCVYFLVYMIMRAGRLSRAGVPILYFLVLALAFLSDAAERSLGAGIDNYFYLQWATWFLGPPLSVLLVIQVAQISRTPELKHFWVLALIPAAFLIARAMVPSENDPEMQSALTIFGIIAGCISLLAIWLQRDVFAAITSEKTGKARYWLILALVFTNIFMLGVMMLGLSPAHAENALMVRTVLGLGFVYLVGTSLFRIYPQAVMLSEIGPDTLTARDLEIARRIESLMTLDKVYHEPAYSRADLARECEVSEAALSRIINLHFSKTFPQLMNEHRIEDAKRMLKETDASVRTVAGEVGFNSLATFNRVFKELTGSSPGQFRQDMAA